MKNSHPKAFTLVEMLIVIVIIGILAAALIPRLTSARGRANDTSRKASIQQVATALIVSEMDKGSLPTTSGGLSVISGALLDAGMSSIPKDPDSSNGLGLSGISANVPVGEFGYQPITKNGRTAGGFVLMAKTETEGGSNYVWCDSTSSNILGTTTYEVAQGRICSSLTSSTTAGACNTTGCVYEKGKGQLRYIYVY